MNKQFDELAKGLAQSITRRGALKTFGLGFAGIALAALGLVDKAEAGTRCSTSAQCDGICVAGHCRPLRPRWCNYCHGAYGCAFDDTVCQDRCKSICSGL